MYVLLKLNGVTSRYFQLLIRVAVTHNYLLPEIGAEYIRQLTLQLPESPEIVRLSSDYVVKIYILEEDLLKLLSTVADIYFVDDLQEFAGALFFVQAQQAMKIKQETEGGENDEVPESFKRAFSDSYQDPNQARRKPRKSA